MDSFERKLRPNVSRWSIDTRESGDRALAWHSGIERRIGIRQASQLQEERDAWLRDRLTLPKQSDGYSEKRQPWDSARIAAMLLLFCGASLGLCVQLVNTLAPEDTGNSQSPLHVGYIFLPGSMAISGFIAMQLHGHLCKSALNSGEVLHRVFLSSFQLLYSTLPIFVLVRSVVISAQSLEFFDSFQLQLLGIAILLPIYTLEVGSDGW